MSQSDQSTIVAVFVALVAASAFFTIIAINAPESISGKQLENGLITQLRFNQV
jgi:hypothetical protein